MLYCGVDLHAKSSAFCVMTRRGKAVGEGQVPSTRAGFRKMLESVGGEVTRVVLESSTRASWAAAQLESLGAQVLVVDPRRVRVIAETKHKTDRTDARILADLLRTGALPKPVWQPPLATRQLRDRVRLRWGLVRQRAALMLRGRSLLSSVGVNLGKRALVSERTWQRVLKRRDVPAHLKELLQILRTAIGQLSEAIEKVEALCEASLADRDVVNMETIPGVGPVVALTTKASLGTPDRFAHSRAAAAYTGLVASERSSGERRRRGHITKQGPSELRRVWIQAAQAALRMRDHPLKQWANRLIYRRGRAAAVVALARRMFRWAYAIWRDGRPFDVRLATGEAV